MNILLWVLQVMLALLCISGGAYKIANFDTLAKGLASMRELPKGLWMLFGAVEVVGGAGLLWPFAVPNAATVIAVESVIVTGLYLYYGDKAPAPYTLFGAVMAIVIAYGRISLKPF